MDIDDNGDRVIKRTEKIVAVLPWGIVGALVVLGSITVVFAGLPFQTHAEAQLQERLLTDKLVTLVESQKKVISNLESLTTSVGILTTSVGILQEQVSTDRKRIEELRDNGRHR